MCRQLLQPADVSEAHKCKREKQLHGMSYARRPVRIIVPVSGTYGILFTLISDILDYKKMNA